MKRKKKYKLLGTDLIEHKYKQPERLEILTLLYPFDHK